MAKSPLGSAQSAFTGTTASGKRVTGSFTPFRFTKKNGNLRARGLVRGVVHQAGPNRTFARRADLPVRRVNGTSVANARQAAAAAAVCRILRLRLGPINLNLLGLRITTNRIKLNIVAVPGPGNLLGNLLCGIAGLLDGPPALAQLTRATRQLNRILGTPEPGSDRTFSHSIEVGRRSHPAPGLRASGPSGEPDERITSWPTRLTLAAGALGPHGPEGYAVAAARASCPAPTRRSAARS